MEQTSVLQEIINYTQGLQLLELGGLIFGLLAVIFLIKENILTWICGIIYVLISFVVFWQAKLYGDFLLHIFFLVLNIYGWYYWVKGRDGKEEELQVTKLENSEPTLHIALSILGIVAFGFLLKYAPSLIDGMEPAALPFWDSTTSILSVTGMWLTAKKKIDNWYYWFVVDILATGIYYYKGMFFYSLLYFIYIAFAVMGYLAWRKSMSQKMPIVSHA